MAEVIWTEPALNDLDAIADTSRWTIQNRQCALYRKYFAMWGNWPITPGAVQSHRSWRAGATDRLSNLPAVFSIGQKAPACSFCTSCVASACFGQAGFPPGARNCHMPTSVPLVHGLVAAIYGAFLAGCASTTIILTPLPQAPVCDRMASGQR
jgi:hypothetical protein